MGRVYAIINNVNLYRFIKCYGFRYIVLQKSSICKIHRHIKIFLHGFKMIIHKTTFWPKTKYNEYRRSFMKAWIKLFFALSHPIHEWNDGKWCMVGYCWCSARTSVETRINSDLVNLVLAFYSTNMHEW